MIARLRRLLRRPAFPPAAVARRVPEPVAAHVSYCGPASAVVTIRQHRGPLGFDWLIATCRCGASQSWSTASLGDLLAWAGEFWGRHRGCA